MQSNKYNILFTNVSYTDCFTIRDIYMYYSYSYVYNELKQHLDDLGLEILGIFGLQEYGCDENLAYYEDDYDEEKIARTYLLSFEEIAEYYKENFAINFVDSNSENLVMVLGSKNCFSIVETYKYDVFLKQLSCVLGVLDNKDKNFDRGDFNGNFGIPDPYKTLKNIIVKSNCILMQYSYY